MSQLIYQVKKITFIVFEKGTWYNLHNRNVLIAKGNT